jgi:hypothetical protein
MNAETDLLERVERLERSNRRLTLLCGACLLVPVLALAGWQEAEAPIPQVLKAHEIQVVDQHGVPLVTLTTGRSEEGGLITLRDKNGEKRAWWMVNPDGASLALAKEKTPQVDGSNTAGFSVTQSSAEMNLIGPGNGMLSATVRDDQPRVDLWSAKGKSLFAAPWQAKP